MSSPKVTNLNFPPKDLTESQATSSRAASKIKAHKKRINTQIHNKRQPTKKELFKCLLPAFTDAREQQGLDHTIYLIGDWSVRPLREWRSTALGCSPGLRLGLGSAVTLHMYNAWFVPPSINNTTPRQLRNKKLTEVAVLSFACNEQLRQSPDYANYPSIVGQDLLSPP